MNDDIHMDRHSPKLVLFPRESILSSMLRLVCHVAVCLHAKGSSNDHRYFYPIFLGHHRPKEGHYS